MRLCGLLLLTEPGGLLVRLWSVCHSNEPAKTAKPVAMPFGLWVQMEPRNRVRWRYIYAEGRCHRKQFWDAVCDNWLFVSN